MRNKAFLIFTCTLALATQSCVSLINSMTSGGHVHNWGYEVPGKSFTYYDEKGALHLLNFGETTCHAGETQNIKVRASMFTKKSNMPVASDLLREYVIEDGKETALPPQKFTIDQDRMLVQGEQDAFIVEPNKDAAGYVVGAFKVLIRKSTGRAYPLETAYACESATAHLKKKSEQDHKIYMVLNGPSVCGSCKGTGVSNKCLQCNGVGFSQEKEFIMGNFEQVQTKKGFAWITTKSKTNPTFPDCKACVNGSADEHDCDKCSGKGCLKCDDPALNQEAKITPRIK